MIQNSKLSQRGLAFSLVLNDSGADVFKNSRYILHKIQVSNLSLIYCAVAYHSRDLNELGNGKTPHYHVVLHMGQRMQVGSVIKLFVEIFNCNENQVQCEKCNDVGAQSRYLIHMDDADKYQYPVDIVHAYPIQTFEKYLERGIVCHDLEDLFNLMEHYHYSIKTIMLVLGESQYKRWRPYIQDAVRLHL